MPVFNTGIETKLKETYNLHWALIN